jgi:hypothetical protein
MKKIAIIIGLGIILTSCNMTTDPVRKSAEAYLLPNLNDPYSYEFVSLTLINTITYLDNIQGRQKAALNSLSKSRDRYNNYRDDLESKQKKSEEDRYLSPPTDIEKATLRAFTQHYYSDSIFVAGLDYITTTLGATVNEIVCYEYEFVFRAKNAMGGLVLDRRLLQITPKYEVITLISDYDKRVVFPKDFPGYAELVRGFGPKRDFK